MFPRRRTPAGAEGTRRTLGVLLVAVAAVLPAGAQAAPTARTPGFSGPTKRIPAKPTAAAPRPSAPLVLAAAGRSPHATVDAAGTAYVTWAVPSDGPDGPRREDAIGFCRIPRGAAACDNPAETRLLVPQKGYDEGAGDGPYLNQEISRGPMPVIVGDQLVILSTRYPTTYGLPDGGTTDRATIQFVSLDGGTSFSGGSPVTAGLSLTNEPVAFGTPESPRIGLLEPVDDGLLFRALTPGAYASGGAVLAPLSGVPEPAQLTPLPNGGIAAVYVDGPGSIAVRRFGGQGDPNDAGSWAPAERLQGYDPSIATGPGGRLLVSRKASSDTDVYTVQALAGPGSATKSSPLHPQRLGSARLLGTGGAATAVYVDPGGTTDAVAGHTGLSVRRSPAGGPAFGAEQRVTTTPRDTFFPSFGAAPDGGGFVASSPVESGVGEVRGHFFGAFAKSPDPGLPTTVPGSATGDGSVTRADCRNRDFGKVLVQIETGCFLQGRRDGRFVAVSEGPIFVNGLKITPIGKTQLVIDPKSKELYTADKGTARVEIPSAETDPIVLWQGGLRQKLQTDAKGRLFNFDTKAFGVKVKGFPVVGALQAYVDGAGASVPVSLALPTPFGDATADATLRVTPSGLRLDSLRLAAPDFTVPPVRVSDLRLSWQREGDRWDGGARITIPSGSELRVDVAVANGKLLGVNAAYELPFPGIAIYPQVYFHQVSAGFEFGPLKLTGGAKIGAVPLAPATGSTPASYLVDLEGKLAVTFGSPFVLRATGEATILSVVPVAKASFEFSTAGYATFGLDVGIGSKPWLFVGADFDAYVGNKGFQANAKGDVCALGLCVGPELLVSSKGVGACAKVPLPTWDPPFVELGAGSVTYPWGGDISVDAGCDLRSITVVGTRSGRTRQKGATAPSTASVSVAVPAGAKALSVNAYSAEDAPTIDLVAPGGTTIDPDAPGDRIGGKASPQAHHRAVVVDRPAAGTWQIVPRAGTPGLTRVTATTPGPAPKLTATLRKAGTGGRRTIAYALKALPDQTVTFAERTAKGERPLSGGGKAGTVTFAPNALVPGKHTVVARIQQDGITKHERVVARFTQPTFRLAAPKRVSVRQAGRRLRVSIVPGRGSAARHVVEIHYGDGRTATAFLGAGKRTATFARPRSGVVGARRTTVEVRPIAPDGRTGRARRATLR